MEEKRRLKVSAALIRDGRRFLICQRPETKARGLLWEFVGGKQEAGESAQQALVRECREELGIEVSVGHVYMQVVHEYPDAVVQLTLFEARIAQGVPQLREHRGICWILPQDIPRFAFCPADEEILQALQKEARA